MPKNLMFSDHLSKENLFLTDIVERRVQANPLRKSLSSSSLGSATVAGIAISVVVLAIALADIANLIAYCTLKEVIEIR